MEGIVLGYESATQNGVIKGNDGKRYHFQRTEWKSDRDPHGNERVDFDINGESAFAIYPLKSATSLAGALESIPVDAIKQRAFELTQRINAAGQGDVKGLFLSKLDNLFSAVMLVAFFMPWFSYMGFSVSGFGIHSLIKQIGEMMDIANQIGSFSESYGHNAPHTGMGSAYMLYLVYLVPVFATLTIWYNMQNIKKPFAIIAGALPFALLLLALFKAGGDVFRGMDIGAYATLLCAGGMIASQLGYIKSPFGGK